ncbi:MAG: C40 family peptidase [Flavobacteriaceae bacterium]|nr:C40 family peptidase [Flavobacteriaceae bacterium]
MRYFVLLLVISIGLTSCKSKKTAKVVTKKRTTSSKRVLKGASPIYKIINHAKSFEGTRYKYGGTTKQGIDCSGLVYVSFQKVNIPIPRTTRDLSKHGRWIDIKKVEKGDLLFFATKKKSRTITHVGIVTSTKNNIEFIHASSSKGVITSSLSERYWYFSFVQARRLM